MSLLHELPLGSSTLSGSELIYAYDPSLSVGSRDIGLPLSQIGGGAAIVSTGYTSRSSGANTTTLGVWQDFLTLSFTPVNSDSKVLVFAKTNLMALNSADTIAYARISGVDQGGFNHVYTSHLNTKMPEGCSFLGYDSPAGAAQSYILQYYKASGAGMAGMGYSQNTSSQTGGYILAIEFA